MCCPGLATVKQKHTGKGEFGIVSFPFASVVWS